MMRPAGLESICVNVCVYGRERGVVIGVRGRDVCERGKDLAAATIERPVKS